MLDLAMEDTDATRGMPEEVKTRANKELDRLNLIPAIAPDGGVIRTYLDWLVTLPWNKASVDRLRNDGDDVGRMMSIGIHPRISGNPARSDALARFIDYALPARADARTDGWNRQPTR